jgi:hypothetical protein
LSNDTQQLLENRAIIDQQPYRAETHAVVMLDTDNRRSPLGFIGADDPQVIMKLAAKLPHYGSYGTLAFSSPETDNLLKQHLKALGSPMARQLGTQPE